MAQAKGLLAILNSPPALFALALGVRISYLTWQGTAPIDAFHPDTAIFLGIAASPDWWAGTAERLPGYPIYLALLFSVFGSEAFWAPLAGQAVIDAAACVAIARTAELLRSGAGQWAGLLSALNPTQIVLSAVLLGDSIFFACIAFGFLALARWWRGQGGALAVGLWFGLALFNRALIWPFIPVLGFAMFMLGLRRSDWRSGLVVLAGVTIFAAPIVARNWIVWGVPALSAQGPIHIALWWYPLVKEAHDGTPYARTATEVTEAFAARGGTSGDFARAAVFSELARESLSTLPPQAYVKAWATGAAINLAAPATLAIPAVMAMPRTGFYATEGNNPIEKAINFLTQSSSAAYLWWLIVGAVLEWPVRLLAFAGLLVVLRTRELCVVGVFAIAWIGFVLAIQGPVAGPKYRLPIEPAIGVLAAVALARPERVEPPKGKTV